MSDCSSFVLSAKMYFWSDEQLGNLAFRISVLRTVELKVIK